MHLDHHSGVSLIWIAILTGYSSLAQDSPPVYNQIPYHPTDPGHLYGNDVTDIPMAPVRIDAFVELNCPDSKHAYQVLPAVVTHYGAANLSLVYYQWPMSYHRNGALSAQTYYLVADKYPDKKWDLMTQVFSHIADYYGTVSAHKTRNEIIDMYGEDVFNVTGMPLADFRSQVHDYKDNMRQVWKFGARRGVAGTPWFFINGVEQAGASDRLSYEDWLAVLDPLYAN